MRYAGVFKKAAHDRAAYVPDLPGCVTTGRTLEDTRRPIVEVIQFQIEPMQLRGEPAPEPIFGRRQTIINILKGGLMALETWFCLANLVLSDWRNQVGIARLDFTCTPAGFSDQALSRMNNPNTGYRRRLWLNVLLLCAPPAGPRMPGLRAHVEVTAALPAAFAGGYNLHTGRRAMVYRPIRERWLAMKLAIEERRS